jgi:hypothetical protein
MSTNAYAGAGAAAAAGDSVQRYIPLRLSVGREIILSLTDLPMPKVRKNVVGHI